MTMTRVTPAALVQASLAANTSQQRRELEAAERDAKRDGAAVRLERVRLQMVRRLATRAP